MKTKHLVTMIILCSALLSAGEAGGVEFLALLSGGNLVQTSSLTFEDMPSMTASISPSANPCITATFSATIGTFTSASESIVFRALLDDVLMEGHFTDDGDVRTPVSPPGNGVEIMTSYTFWKCDIASGDHTMKIQWHSRSGNAVLALGRALVIQGQ